MIKQKIKLTEREKTILGMAKHLSIETPYNPIVGILGKNNNPKWVTAYLPIISHNGNWSKLRFSPQINYDKRRKGEPTLERCQQLMNDCKKYLNEFVGKTFILNYNDEKEYSPGFRTVTMKCEGSWDHTKGLYTLAGQKVPNIIKGGFDINDLEKISKRLKKEDFHFSINYLDERDIKKIPHLKLSDILISGEWDCDLIEEC